MAQDDIREKVEELIKALVNTAHARSLYGAKHELTKKAVDNLYAILRDLLAKKDEITVGIIGTEVAFEEAPFYEMSKRIKGFIDHLKEIKAEKLTFLKGVKKEELTDLISILTMKTESLDKAKGLDGLVDSTKMTHIGIGEIGFRKDQKGKSEEEEIRVIARKDYRRGIEFLTKVTDNIKKDQPIDIASARQLTGSIIRNLLRNKDLLLILSSTKSHDESTFVHDINVAIFTLMQAEALGLDEAYLNDIGTAALLHDVGKLSISGDILRKKGKLTQEESERISKHPIEGAKILLESPDIEALAAIGAFEHHILYDMTGYPKRLYGGGINLVSMLVTIADYYDALRSRRYYHEEMAPEKTYEDMIKLSGKHFHPELLNNFFSIIGVYPPGTLVELDTKEIGIVLKENAPDIKRPQVEILYDEKGKKKEGLQTVDLLEKDKKGNYRRTIVKSILASDKFQIPAEYL